MQCKHVNLLMRKFFFFIIIFCACCRCFFFLSILSLFRNWNSLHFSQFMITVMHVELHSVGRHKKIFNVCLSNKIVQLNFFFSARLFAYSFIRSLNVWTLDLFALAAALKYDEFFSWSGFVDIFTIRDISMSCIFMTIFIWHAM